VPTISVIIPTYNRPVDLKRCLDALTHEDYPRAQFEVIVVDDGSVIPMNDTVMPFQDRIAVSLIRQPNSGPAAARNAGVAIARGRLLAFTDDDCAPSPQWLRELHEKSKQNPNAAIGGPKRNGYPNNIYSTASEMLSEYIQKHFNTPGNQTPFFTTNNLLVPKDIFDRIGGFNSKLPFGHEDREFGERWYQNGGITSLAEDALVYHYHKLSFTSFCRQHFIYGCGASHFRQVRQGQSAEKIRFAGISFYTRLLSLPFHRTSGFRALILSALLFLSQFIYITAFFWESFRLNILGQTFQGNTFGSYKKK
jgi:GT2 family glycosyltransferase